MNENPLYQHDNNAAFQYGMDSYYENWSLEKQSRILVDCIDTDYFWGGYYQASDQDVI